MVDLSGEVFFYLNDHLGSARLVIDTAGTVRDQYDYTSFGAPKAQSVSLDQSYRYTGKPYDEDGGIDIYYYGARYYDPDLGRFLAVDPLAAKYANMTPYQYAANNPLKYYDPDGRDIGLAIDYSGAFGAGHHMLFIGTDETGWTSFSYEKQSFDKGGSIDIAMSRAVIMGFEVPGSAELRKYGDMTLQQIIDGLGSGDLPRIQGRFAPNNVIVVKTTLEQDQIALANAKSVKENPPDYALYCNNCSDQAVKTANEAGANFKEGMIPNVVHVRNSSMGRVMKPSWARTGYYGLTVREEQD